MDFILKWISVLASSVLKQQGPFYKAYNPKNITPFDDHHIFMYVDS